jgi:hypothetical protein
MISSLKKDDSDKKHLIGQITIEAPKLGLDLFVHDYPKVYLAHY